MPSRCCVRLLVIAIATALCLAGIPAAPGGPQIPDDSGQTSVRLSPPAAHAPSAIRITRVEDGASFVSFAVTVAPERSFEPSDDPPRPLPAEPPNAFRDALRALPLTPRPPPLA
jgi:hypothetical protein